MKIKSHAESHIVEWLTLANIRRRPRSYARLEARDRSDRRAVGRRDQLACAGGWRRKVHVIDSGENWPVGEVKSTLKDG